MKSIWTKEQINYLIKNYEHQKTPILIAALKNKTNDQIRWKAKEFKLNKKISRTKTDCSFLENFDDPESLYWWGFLTADGCITPRQIIFSLEEKDKEYVDKFARKCGSIVHNITRINSWHKVPYTMARTVVNDKFIIARLINKLKIKPQKTYNPFDLSEFLTKERLAYFIGGLTDGDGYIGNGGIRIKVHFNWKKSFDLLSQKLNAFYNLSSTSYITKQGWAMLSINKKDANQLRQILINKIPIMSRKWNRVIDVREK